MVGLADIPCVGKIVERVSEYTVEAVFRGLRYMFRYKSLVNELNSEIGKLNIEKDNMSRKVKEEKDNGKEILPHVVEWQKDVEEIQKSDKEFSPSCSCIQRLPIPNPVSRFRIGRNAAKKAKTVAELKGTGKEHLTGEIAHHPPFQNKPNSDTAFEEFESRKDVYKKLWDSLVNEDSPLICGIYGMAGVGKTRMMKKFWEEAMEKKIFKEVVRVDVGSENLEKVDLQDKIADSLNCKLDFRDMERRASQLEKSIKDRGKILLILDDVWREIHLDKIIGTPFGDGSSSSKGSKILLTSREKEVCLDNKCEHLVEIETLKPGEALDLFKKAVGPDTINDLQDESLVQNVCDECGHLPLLIHAVGKALKGKSSNLWTDAHNQLMEGKFQKIAGVKPKVYTGIKLSIDYLQNDDAKSCLFLCSMFPEDANIDMKMLIQLATGSRLGESRVLAMVDSLKTSSLLLDSGEDDEIKVHDIIRDVARSVASTDSKYAFLHVKCNSKQFPSNASDCTGKFLRLDAETDDVHFEERKVCPDLHTLWLQCNNHPQQFSGGFFSMFEILSCLMLQNVNISVEQFSLKPLGNLGTLSLLECDIRKTDVSLFPKNLKTLCICECELPLPLDVANLECLLKLEIQHGGPVLVKVDVISSLSSLEELHISNGFINDHEEYHLEPIVMEISKLTRLKSLHFEFYEDEDNTFQGTDIFSNIDRYNLFVGTPKQSDPEVRDWRVPLTRLIEFRGNNWQPWEGLMARAEEVRLLYSDVEVSSICNGHTRTFQDLKRLYIFQCNKMGHLASKSQDEIQYSSLQSPACFSKLTILDIQRCSKLKYLFCNNIAKSLVQLQQLSVKRCESMEAIIMNEGTSDGEIINFSKLTNVYISDCSKLKYLFCNNIAKSLVQLQQLTVRDCESMEAIIMNEGTSDGEIINFSKLTNLQIWGCSKLKYLFCNNIAKSLVQLQELFVFDCPSMEAIIMNEGTSDGEIINFSKLTNVDIWRCSKLKYLFCNNIAKSLVQLQQLSVKRCESMEAIIMNEGTSDGEIINFSKLTELHIESCSKLNYLFCNNIAKSLVQLQQLRVEDCESMEAIIMNEGTSDGEIINFSKLTNVDIWGCSKLKYLFCNNIAKSLVQLQQLSVKRCESMEAIIMNEGTSDGEIINFSKLINLEISWCFKLKYLFCNNIAKSLVQLQQLRVRGCESMEAIIMNEGTSDGEIINFPKLKSLTISDTPRLTSFHGQKENMHSGLTSPVDNCAQYQPLFDGKVAFPFLEELDIMELPYTSVIWGNDCFIESTVSSFCKLKHLSVAGCHELEIVIPMLPRVNNLETIYVFDCSILRSMFPPAVASNLKHLKEMKVFSCGEMREIIEAGEQVITDDGILFPQLTDLKLDELPSLTSFWCYQSGKASSCKVPLRLPQLSSIDLEDLPHLKSFFHGANFEFHMPALKEVKVDRCGLLTLFTLSVFREIRQLEGLHVSNCELLERIVEEVESDETSEINGKSITSSQLSSITLESLPNLKSFGRTGSYVLNMPNLKRFTLIECPRIEYFSSSKTNAPLVRVSIDWGSEEGIQDLNDLIRQNRKRGSYLSEHAGESEIIEEEEPQESETETDYSV